MGGWFSLSVVSSSIEGGVLVPGSSIMLINGCSSRFIVFSSLSVALSRELFMVIFNFFSMLSAIFSSKVFSSCFSLLSMLVCMVVLAVLNLSSMYSFRSFSIDSIVVGVVVVLLMVLFCIPLVFFGAGGKSELWS